MMPHRIDCGLRKTTPIARSAPRSQSWCPPPCRCDGSRRNSSALIARPPTPMAIQNCCHGSPAPITGPTTNWPADPPAMPNICVAPISVAAREAGKLVVAM